MATDKGLCIATPDGFKKIVPGRILTLAKAPDGHIWAAGSPGGTLFEVDPASLTWKTQVVDVLPRGRITAGLAVDSQGTPWAADRYGGLARGTRSGSGWTWSSVLIDGRTPKDIYGVSPIPDGGVVVLHDGAASMLRGGHWKAIPDLLPELPSAVALGPGGRMAFAYRNRAVITLHRMGGDKVVRTGVVPVQGPDNVLLSIFSLAMDNLGHVWMGTNAGLGKLTGTDASGFQMMGLEDRLVSPECNEGAILAEPGRIWIGTTSGLVSFNASAPPAPPVLQKPLVLWARAGQQNLDVAASPPRLPRNSNELELKFMIPTYQAPGRIYYEAWLAGVDPGWIRLDDAHLRYAGLRAGRYSLALRGVLSGAAGGPVESLDFTVIPAWWETPWAQILGVLALAAAVWLLFWLRHVALEARNRQLQEEVARQTSALQEASRAKSAFLANMSHELRTPLNAILLYSELMQEEAKEMGHAATIEDAAKISQSGSSLLKLIDDILDISKIEAGHVHLDMENIELGRFMERMDFALRPLVEKKGNRFEVEDAGAPRVIRCDSTRLQQILANLLSNAAKFTENGKVTLTASSDRGWAVFEVEDTGIGMTPEEQIKVFSEFVQADSSTTRKYGGTGLGLALVQRLTEMLGGRVDMRSAPGAGTCVSIRIPCGDKEIPVR